MLPPRPAWVPEEMLLLTCGLVLEGRAAGALRDTQAPF